MICGRPRYRAAAHVVRRRGHPLSPPVVAGSRALGFQGAGGIPLLAPARCPCAACAAGAPCPAPLRSVGGAPCAGRSDGRSGRVPLVPGCFPPVVPRPRAVSPPVVAGSIALGHQGAGGMPLLASARCPCAACAAGASRPATPCAVGEAPCAGRCGSRSGRVPFVPGCFPLVVLCPRPVGAPGGG